MTKKEQAALRRKEAGMLRDKFMVMSVPALKGARTRRVNQLLNEMDLGLPHSKIAENHLPYIRMAEAILSNKGVSVAKLRPKCPKYYPPVNW